MMVVVRSCSAMIDFGRDWPFLLFLKSDDHLALYSSLMAMSTATSDGDGDEGV